MAFANGKVVISLCFVYPKKGAQKCTNQVSYNSSKEDIEHSWHYWYWQIWLVNNKLHSSANNIAVRNLLSSFADLRYVPPAF